MSQLALTDPSVAEMTARPSATPVIRPFWSTEATAVLSLDQTTGPSTVAFSGTSFAVRSSVLPLAMAAIGIEISIFSSAMGAATTVTSHEAVTSPHLALTVVVPAVTPVTVPSSSIRAVFESSLDQRRPSIEAVSGVAAVSLALCPAVSVRGDGAMVIAVSLSGSAGVWPDLLSEHDTVTANALRQTSIA